MYTPAFKRKIAIRIFSLVTFVLVALLTLLSAYAYYFTSAAILNTITAQNESLMEQANNFV